MSVHDIMERAAEAWGSTPDAMRGPGRLAHHVRARRLAARLLAGLLDLPPASIGDILWRDASMVRLHILSQMHPGADPR